MPMFRIGPEVIPIKNELPPTTRTPPRDAEMRPFNIHLAATQRLPEPFHALLMHIRGLDGVEQVRRERKPLLKVFDAQETETVNKREGQGCLFRHGRGFAEVGALELRRCWLGE